MFVFVTAVFGTLAEMRHGLTVYLLLAVFVRRSVLYANATLAG